MIEKAYSKEELVQLFKALGVSPGMVLEVHVAMSAFGYIIGGSQTLIDALLECVGYNGTLVMPLQCCDRTEPSYFEKPPMTFDLLDKYRKHLPAFDPMVTDTFHMSKVYDALRRKEGACIYSHPTVAFVAYGKYARLLCEDYSLSFPLSKEKILGKLYALKAHCLLIGVDYDNMTSLHLSEYETKVRPILLQGSKIKVQDEEKWVKYLDYKVNSDDGFMEIGHQLELKNLVNTKELPKGSMKLLRVDIAVDEGIAYYQKRLEAYKK